MASPYVFFENEITARQFLTKKYQHPEAKTLAYRNVYAFTSYIKQGLALFQAAKESNFWSQPVLLYYGMMSLLKAVALTIDSEYPQTTSVLQHGLTSPKRKKTPYRFYHDEVRVQRDGFFPYLCQLLQHPVATGERFKIDFLCSFLPDIQPMMTKLYQQKHQWPIDLQSVDNQSWKISLSTALLDHLCISTNSLTNRLNAGTSPVQFEIENETSSVLMLQCSQNPEQHPWIYQQINGDYSLLIGNSHQIEALPEILAHYALLFALSMLCRYNPPLWRELFNDMEQDQLLVGEIISVVQEKFPVLVLTLLMDD